MMLSQNDNDDDRLKCRNCQYYRPEDSQCMFGGGWFHYPSPDDECERMNYGDDERKQSKKK